MTNAEVIKWLQFFLRLAATRAWRGFQIWFYVVAGALAASGTGVVDIKQIGWKGGFYTLLGTMLAQIAFAFFKYEIPDPTPPNATPPTPTT